MPRPAGPRTRTASALLVLSTLLCAAGTAGAGAGDALDAASLFARVGRPKNPAYVYVNELTDVESLRFRKAPGLQIRKLGEGPIRLDPRQKHYLWAIDAQGKLRVAPIEKGADGSESIGHTNLTGGRPARLGGELVWVPGRGQSGHWMMNNDSGRYSEFYPEVTRANLEAAREVVERIGIRNVGGRGPAKTRTEFFTPRPVKSGAPGDVRNLARKGRVMRKLGGYVLMPPRGIKGWSNAPPEYRKYRSSGLRHRWGTRARRSLGLRRRTGRREAFNPRRARERAKRSRTKTIVRRPVEARRRARRVGRVKARGRPR